jgi:hypothetical protein
MTAGRRLLCGLHGLKEDEIVTGGSDYMIESAAAICNSVPGHGRRN